MHSNLTSVVEHAAVYPRNTVSTVFVHGLFWAFWTLTRTSFPSHALGSSFSKPAADQSLEGHRAFLMLPHPFPILTLTAGA